MAGPLVVHATTLTLFLSLFLQAAESQYWGGGEGEDAVLETDEYTAYGGYDGNHLQNYRSLIHTPRSKGKGEIRVKQERDMHCWLDRVSLEYESLHDTPQAVAGVLPVMEPMSVFGDEVSVPLASRRSRDPVKPTLVVDCKGRGDFKTIMDAVRHIRSINKKRPDKQRIVVYIKACTYTEKVQVNSSLEYVTFKGESADKVFVQWGDTAGTRAPGTRRPMGTFRTATFALNADYGILEDITFVNTAPRPDVGSFNGMAVAYRVTADFVAHYNCRFFGWQDTLYDHVGKHYFYGCYIQGSVDFIFGNGSSIYERCTVFSAGQGFITAQKRFRPNDDTGFVFLRSKIIGAAPTFLGRAWGNHSRVVYAFCYLEDIIKPGGWDDFNDPRRKNTAMYAEYKNTGPGAVTFARSKWTYILTDRQAAPYLTYAFIDRTGWLPKERPRLRSWPTPPYGTRRSRLAKPARRKRGGRRHTGRLSLPPGAASPPRLHLSDLVAGLKTRVMHMLGMDPVDPKSLPYLVEENP